MNAQALYIMTSAYSICQKHKIAYDQVGSILGIDLPDLNLGLCAEDPGTCDFDQVLDVGIRMTTGSYYTPEALAERMVAMTFYEYFTGHGLLSHDQAKALFLEGLLPRDLTHVAQVIDRLSGLKIMDPACGTGVFIKVAYKCLDKTYSLLGHKVSKASIIDQLYGMDIQGAPLSLLNLWLLDKCLDQGDTVFKSNMTCQDALLCQDHALFDMVIGNPPYLGEKGHKDVFKPYKHLEAYEGKMDLFYFFIYKGYDLLKADGIMNFITTNYFITADGAKKLRAFLKTKLNFRRIINLDACKLFKDAPGMHNLIFYVTAKPCQEVKVLTLAHSKVEDLDDLYEVDYLIDQYKLYTGENNIALYKNMAYAGIVEKIIQSTTYALDHYVDINQGIVSGADRVSQAMLNKKIPAHIVERYSIKKDDPIFVTQDPGAFQAWAKPFYKNSHIQAYRVDHSNRQWILYLKDDLYLDKDHDLYQYLLPYKDVLQERREVKSGRKKWYALQWYRRQEIFEGVKLVVPQRSKFNRFAYVEEPFYASADVYYLTGNHLHVLLGILNSKLMYFWLFTRGKRKGKDLELYAKPLSQIPIPNLDTLDTEPLILWVKEMILHADTCIQKKIDAWVYAAYGLAEEDISVIEDLYVMRS